MITLDGGVDDVLSFPLHLDYPVLVVLSVTDFAFAQVHISSVEHQFVPFIEPVVKFGMRSEPVLFLGICPCFRTVSRRALYVIYVRILASEEILVRHTHYKAESVSEIPVTERETSDDIRSRTGLGHSQVFVSEVICSH